MGVDSTHPLYNSKFGQWTKCRDCYEGSEVIKDKGQAYLPRLEGMSDQDYESYKNRALFYAITSKTVSALVGISTVQKPVMKYPVEMKSYFEDRAGLQFQEIWGKSLTDTLLVGRIGGLVDVPINDGEPYISLYPCENILNWEVDDYGVVTKVVLFESYYERDINDEFKLVPVSQYRVLRLRDGLYTIQIYSGAGVPNAEYIPTFLGKQLKYVPFYIMNPFGLGTELVKPPMMDIVNINISHYLSSADLEHGRHFTGLPTPVAIGVPEGTKMYIGSGTAWVIPDPSGNAKYLEFTGQGLQSLEKALVEKQSQLASLSARFIDNSAKGSENVSVVQLRFMSETSSLVLNIRSTQAFMNALYKTVADMKGLDPTSVDILMNTNLMSTKLDGSEVYNLVKSYIEGGISAETLVYNLQRGEIISTDRDINEEIKSIVDALEDKKEKGKEKADKTKTDPKSAQDLNEDPNSMEDREE